MTRVFKLYGPGHPSHDTAAELPAELDTAHGTFHVDFRRFEGGASAGVEMLQISGRQAGFALLPTRGMGIWRAWAGETPFGWRSPVHGPVHPSRVPLWDPSGLGWLEGFDELLVRCGLESNGAPEFDERHQVRFPLHGRIANLPTESLAVTVDDQAGTIEVAGTVRQSRLFFAHLTMQSTIRLHIDSDTVEVIDRVTNQSDRPAVHQMLYHINVGMPVLGDGARLLVPPAEVVPKNARAADSIDSFTEYGGPQVGFAEQVYLMRLQCDADKWTRALLRAADGESGFGLHYDTSTLPYFIQWKNTGGERDGYVTGLEPATNFPNTRSFEEANGRVVHLDPQQSVTYRMHLHLLSGRNRVDAFASAVEELVRETPKVAREPREGWGE